MNRSATSAAVRDLALEHVRSSTSSIRFANRFRGRTASFAEHRAVPTAIEASDETAAHDAMRELISDVMMLIEKAGRQAGDKQRG